MDDGLRLRRPDRSQMSFGLLSPEDLVAEDHAVRVVWRVVQSLDLSAFRAPLKARAGVAGRDATDRRCWWRCGSGRRCGASGRRGSWRGCAGWT